MDISLNDNNLEFILAETAVETKVTEHEDNKITWKCTICSFS